MMAYSAKIDRLAEVVLVDSFILTYFDGTSAEKTVCVETANMRTSIVGPRGQRSGCDHVSYMNG